MLSRIQDRRQGLLSILAQLQQIMKTIRGTTIHTSISQISTLLQFQSIFGERLSFTICTQPNHKIVCSNVVMTSKLLVARHCSLVRENRGAREARCLIFLQTTFALFARARYIKLVSSLRAVNKLFGICEKPKYQPQ